MFDAVISGGMQQAHLPSMVDWAAFVSDCGGLKSTLWKVKVIWVSATATILFLNWD